MGTGNTYLRSLSLQNPGNHILLAISDAPIALPQRQNPTPIQLLRKWYWPLSHFFVMDYPEQADVYSPERETVRESGTGEGVDGQDSPDCECRLAADTAFR